MISRFALSSRVLLNNGAACKALRSLPDSRSIHVGNISFLKEIKIAENKDEIVVEAVRIPSDRTDNLVPVPNETQASHSSCTTCPLCRLNLRGLAYSDVLILQQFVESNGNLMPRPMTGLCGSSYKRIKHLVQKAQISKLLPRPADFPNDGPWMELNTYFEYPRRSRDKPMDVVKKEYWK